MSITEKVANEASDGLEAEKHDSNKFEDLPKDSSGEEVVPKELLDFYLPVEVWVHAWSFLDFNTRQKICTLVSKTWLNQIRNSSILSGEMKISTSDTNYFEEFEISDAVLLRWKKLKVLHVKSEKEIQRFGNFSQHKLLEKIVVWNEYAPRNQNLKFEELGSWGLAKKSWFNPKHPLNPATLENVVAVEIRLTEVPPNFEMEQVSQRMKNLEDLRVAGLNFKSNSAIGIISSFKNLKVLHIGFCFNYSENETEMQFFGNFSEHKLLEKIVVVDHKSPRNRLISKELGSWGTVTKSWFNPKLPLNPTTLENVVAIEINLGKISPNFEMEKTAQRLKNLKSLQIYNGERAIVSEIGFISSFKNLKKVDFHTNSPLQDLTATLNYLASLNLNISGRIDVSGSLEQQISVFEEAVQILNEKFPKKHENDESFLYIYAWTIYGMSMSIRFDGKSAILDEDAFLEYFSE